MRRRLMLEQDKVVVTFQDLVDALTALGASTGTDENGFYVEAKGPIVDGKVIISLPPSDKRYSVYCKGYNTNGTDASNIRMNYATYTGIAIPLSMLGTTALSSTGQQFVGIKGHWYSGVPKIYDFYIEEV